MDDFLAGELTRGCSDIGIELHEEQTQKLIDYVDLLSKWNRAYNLTAIRDPGQMVIRHLLDSLAIASYCHGHRILDVGTGAGLPGIPLAIFFPDKEFHLLDSNGKKTRFLFHVKTSLALDNISVHQARVEQFRWQKPFDLILSRAFASLDTMVESCRHLLAESGYFLAMKGSVPELELEGMDEHCQIQSVHSIVVPGLNEQRHLVAITNRKIG